MKQFLHTLQTGDEPHDVEKQLEGATNTLARAPRANAQPDEVQHAEAVDADREDEEIEHEKESEYPWPQPEQGP